MKIPEHHEHHAGPSSPPTGHDAAIHAFPVTTPASAAKYPRRMSFERVLFVCVHNAGRSQMAEAILNHLATAEGHSIRAESAGTLGGTRLNPQAVEALEEIGIETAGLIPKLLTQEMADRADRIISMGCGVDAEACPARFMVTEDWGLDDPAGQPIETVRRIRDEIMVRCRELLAAGAAR